ncbi:MAG TPA: universal stress protein [Acidimicrobiales bacterium]|jgi:nucleotide-binding universal stress UspA family protein
MGCVVVAVAEGETRVGPLSEALRLLGPDHEYVFLSVEQGVVPAVLAEGGLAATAVVPDDVTWAEVDRAARAAGSTKLAAFVEQLPARGRVRIETGDPAERICAVAAEEHADLVVIGSTHVGAIRRLIGGSVTDDVAHHAPCAVLLTRNGH